MLKGWISYQIFKKKTKNGGREAWHEHNSHMGIAGKDRGEIFQYGGGVQFLHKDKLKSELFNENKSLLTKHFSSINLNSGFSYF